MTLQFRNYCISIVAILSLSIIALFYSTSIVTDLLSFVISDADVAFATGGPSAEDDQFETNEGQTINLDVLLNDFSDISSLTVCPGSISLANPAHGILVDNGTSVTYIPADGFFGTAQFTYQACDEFDVPSEIASVTIEVNEIPNQAPVAVNDSYTINARSSSQTTILDNDYDTDGQINLQSVVIQSMPQYGSIQNTNNVWVFTPNLQNVAAAALAATSTDNPAILYDINTTVQDSFTYTIEDNEGLVSNTATVSISIAYDNADPVLVPQEITIQKGDIATFNPFTITDADNDSPFTTSVVSTSSDITNCSITSSVLECIIDDSSTSVRETVLLSSQDSLGLQSDVVEFVINIIQPEPQSSSSSLSEESSQLSSVQSSEFSSSSVSAFESSQSTSSESVQTPLLIRSGGSSIVYIGFVCMLVFSSILVYKNVL